MRKYLVLSVMLTCSVFSGYAIKITRSVFPNEITAGGEIVVSLTVEKEGVEGFAKLIENVPEGFKAVELNSATGNFIFENGKVRIIWLTIPEGDSYKAEYKLIHIGTNTGSIKLNGKFFYVKGDKRTEFTLPAFSVKVKEKVEPKELVVLIQETEAVEAVVESELVEEIIIPEVEEIKDSLAEAVIVEVVEPETPVEEVLPIEVATVEPKETPAANVLFFKVQLGAYSSEKPQSTFGNLPDIHFIKTGNIYKYYSGKFTNEASARAIIPEAQAQGFKGAFLVRFKDGKRI